MNMTIFYLFIYCMEGFIFFLYADRIFTVGKSRHACLLGTCVLYGLLFLFSFSDLVWLKQSPSFSPTFYACFYFFASNGTRPCSTRLFLPLSWEAVK